MPDEFQCYSSSPLPSPANSPVPHPTRIPTVASNLCKRKGCRSDSNIWTDEKPSAAPHEYAGIASDQSTSDGPVTFTPEIATKGLAHPPAKRRRKRTEEERIEYLRSDPYARQFEAYQVLCASCNKWIRLRRNSTYCSTPWDAHRNGCLAKRINNKIVHALEERNTLFSDDPLVRNSIQHRAIFQRSAASSSSTIRKTHRTLVDEESPDYAAGLPSQSTSSVPHVVVPRRHVPPYSAQPFHALSNYGSIHESRNCDAEHQDAKLEGPHIIVVGPNKVFCNVCSNRIELCQACANPCRQVVGHFRRTQKAIEVKEMGARKPAFPPPDALEDGDLASNYDLAPARRYVAIPGLEGVEFAKGVEYNRGHRREIESRADQRQITRHPYGSPSYSGHGHYSQQAQPYQHRKTRGPPTLDAFPETPHTYPGGSMSQIIHPIDEHKQSEILSAPKTSNQVADHDGPTTTMTAFFKDIDNVRISRATFNINVFPQDGSHDNGPSHTGWRSPGRGGERTITRQTLQPPFHDATRMPSPILNDDRRRVAQGYTASGNPTTIMDAFDRHPFDVPFPPVTYGVDPISPHYLPDPDIDLQVSPSDDDQKRQRRRRKKRVLRET